jgi:hypothetical protein
VFLILTAIRMYFSSRDR